MKQFILPVFVSAALSTSSLSAGGSTVSFTGEIVAGACGIDAGSLDQTVRLGVVSANRFKAAGDRSASQTFDVTLTDCDTSVARNAYFTFIGTGHPAAPALLGVVGAARNVGVRLQAASGEYIDNGFEQKRPIVLQHGSNVVRFSAMYEATAATVTPGRADAVANFRVRYH
ncbi:fimbrial protein [Burkholderia guangdongensis]|uniref:fimbrial protein n=1 Tax=Burkholderia guangdongensis TaxID=1792500 RepID=UPI0015CBBF7F|nr:fimbrial protein [Burkholderia guangdongensis]